MVFYNALDREQDDPSSGGGVPTPPQSPSEPGGPPTVPGGPAPGAPSGDSGFALPPGFWAMSGFDGPTGPGFQIPGAPQFTPPTAEEAQNSPGYKFRLGEGERALQNSAAARGVLRTGGTLKDIIGYGQNFAGQEYQNVFDRALSAHDRRQGAWATTLQAEQARSLAAFNRAWDIYKYYEDARWARLALAAQIGSGVYAEANKE